MDSLVGVTWKSTRSRRRDPSAEAMIFKSWISPATIPREATWARRAGPRDEGPGICSYPFGNARDERPIRIWAPDIIYLPLVTPGMFKRSALSFRLSNAMGKNYCLDPLRQAVAPSAAAGLLSTRQPTAEDLGQPLEIRRVRVRMDAERCCVDNVFIMRPPARAASPVRRAVRY